MRAAAVGSLVLALQVGNVATARSQLPTQIEATAGIGLVRVHSDLGAAEESLRGPAFAADAALGFGRLGVQLGYVRGRLSAADSTPLPRNVTEGAVAITFAVHRLLTVAAGPRARAYTSDVGTRRWLMWEARVHGEAPLHAEVASVYAELRGAFGGTTNTAMDFRESRGGEVGIWVRLSSAVLRIAYSVDRTRGRDPVHQDMIERLVISGGFERR